MKMKFKKYLTIFNKETFSIFSEMWKNSILFIIFSFLNVFLPIFICIISANLDTNGAYATMGIGYVTSFQLAYSQIGLSFAIFASYYFFKKRKDFIGENNDHLVHGILLIALLYGVIITPLYIGPAYVYTKYANAHTNTVDSLNYAYNFIYSSSGFVLLTTFASALIMNLKTKQKTNQAILQVFLMFGTIIILSSVLGLLTPLKEIGLGLGLTIGSVLSIVFSFLNNYFGTDTFKKTKISILKIDLKNIIQYTWRPVIMVLSIQVFKGAALLFLNYQIPNELNGAVPLNFQMSRILWYNMMYLIPFLILGFSDSLYFYFAKYPERKKNSNTKFAILFTFCVCALLTVCIIVSCTFIVNPLTTEYVKNQNHIFSNDDVIKDVGSLTKEKIINLINNSAYLDETKKNILIEYLNRELPSDGSTIGDKLGSYIANNFLQHEFTEFDVVSISNLIIFPNSYSYFYLGTYCMLYPMGQFLNASRLSMTDEKHPAILMVFFQALAITFIVQFAITYQTSQRFWLLEAWSFPLAVIGVIAFIYMSGMYFIKTDGLQYFDNKNNTHKKEFSVNEIKKQEVLTDCNQDIVNVFICISYNTDDDFLKNNNE